MRFHLKRVINFWGLIFTIGLILLVRILQNQSEVELVESNPLEEKRTPILSSQPPAPSPLPVAQGNESRQPIRAGRLYPRPGDREDRILDQLEYELPEKPSRVMQILVYGGLHRGVQQGSQRFINDNCKVQACSLSGDRSIGPTADAVLFQNQISSPSWTRPANQLWAVYFLESPLHTTGLGGFENKINFSATYRRDSILVTPYERFTFHDGITRIPDKPPKDYLEGKTKMVAWFVSNCNARNGRMEYVKELQKYMEVDIYGHCGQLKCPRSKSHSCFDKLDRDYKFYLAFENSNCRDYITEKLYWNGLLNDVVPVVMGATPEDYRVAAPPESYIHVDDFESPEALAKYLTQVGSDPDLYNSYFRWKGTGRFINTKFWCRLCTMVHYAQENKVVHRDPHKWWHGKDVCVNPAKGQKWATWRGVSNNFTYVDPIRYGEQGT